VEQLLAVLPADGSWMAFADFIVAARAAGVRAELWRRGKQAGLLETRIDGDYTAGGVHQIRKVVSGGS